MRTVKSFIVLLLMLVSSVPWADERYQGIYVFGDSLSDTGNLASVVPGFPDFPYYQGRFSNGPVSVEIMAQQLGLPLKTSLHLIGPAVGNNYAVAGASAARNDSIDLNTQVAWFLANHEGAAPANNLYVMYLGGNDIRHARDTEDWGEAVQLVEEAARVIVNQIQVLAASGARHWLVVNAPDLGNIPETRLIAEAYGLDGLPVRTTMLSILFNGALKKNLHELKESSEVEIEHFDLFKLFGRIVEKADKLGFSNNKDACFSSQLAVFAPGCNNGQSFDQYIYFDEIHSTARVHELIGIALSRKVMDEDESRDRHRDRDERKRKKEVESAHD